jgi:peptidoglycan-N-acetylglucosamine deacetylase
VRRGPVAAGGIAAAAAAAWCGPAPAVHVPPFARLFGLACRLDGAPGVALTFDDGPHPRGTPAVLEHLRAAGVEATFFLVGEQVERWPTLAAEIAAAGHEVGVHGYPHRLLLRRPGWELSADLDRCADLLARLTDRPPRLYRPPYGVFSTGAIVTVRRAGLLPLLWSRWGRDWGRRATPEAIAARAGRDLRAGDVVLLHDADHYSAPGSWRATAAAVPLIVEAAAAARVPFVSASQAM